jgi:hypothetical protein
MADTAQTGSIGVVAVYRKGAERGTVEFVSSQSPNKRPDLETEAGRGQVQRVVDDIAAVFVRDVARYRGVSEEAVLQGFGAGGVLVGAAAVEAGLADSLGSFEGMLKELTTETRRARRVGERGNGRMDATEERDERTGGVEPQPPSCGIEPPHSMEAAELARLQEQLRAERERAAQLQAVNEELALSRTELEARNAALQAESERRSVEELVTGLAWNDGKVRLAPQCREGLTEALLALSPEGRSTMLATVQDLRFYEAGVRGFSEEERADTVPLTAAEEGLIAEEAKRKGISVELVRQQFVAARKAQVEQGRYPARH